METQTITPLIELEYSEFLGFGSMLTVAGLFVSPIDLLDYFKLYQSKESGIGLISYYQGLLEQWNLLSSPMLESENWSQFVSYVSSHPYSA